MDPMDPMDHAASTKTRSCEAVEKIAGRRDSGVLFLCDHAANSVPADYDRLGLPPAAFERHIAYDIGAAWVTRRLAAAFDAPAVLTTFSRLLVDPNRGLDDPTLVMRLSESAIIPGNAAVDTIEIEKRIKRFWRPYRAAASALRDAMREAGPAPAIVSIHSFTPNFKGVARPFELAVLWDKDPRLASPLIDALRESGFSVGDNEPYDGALEGDTLNALATAHGLANVLIEIRQDLIGDHVSAERMADRLAGLLRPILDRPETHIFHPYGSRAGARRFANEGAAMMIDKRMQTELEAAAFRRLVGHLRERADVQNIDLMNLAGFCRNCLSNWLQDAARERGLTMTKDEARERVYGMAYEEWKALHQREATAEQAAAFAAGSKSS